MTRALLRVTIATTCLFAGLFLLVRARPYEDAGLRAFLMPPEDCAPPCWLGVRPGETPLAQGSRILQDNAWISALKPLSPATAWLDFSPTSLTLRRGRLNLWPDEAGLIKQVELYITEVTLGDVLLALGSPERMVLYETVDFGTNELTAMYPHYSLYVTATIRACALHQASFWHDTGRVTVTVGLWQNSNKLYPNYYPSSIELDARHWASQLRVLRLCPS